MQVTITDTEIVFIAFTILSIISVTIRLCCRHIERSRIWSDDWLASLALIFYIPFIAIGFLVLWQLQSGINDSHIQQQSIMRSATAAISIYTITTTLVRLSACMHLARIFQNSNWQKAAYVIFYGSVLCGVYSFIITFLPCVQLVKFTTPVLPGYCNSYLSLSIPVKCLSILIDVMIAILPLRPLWQLRLPNLEKAGLSCVFTLWIGVIVVDVLRLYTTVATPTTTQYPVILPLFLAAMHAGLAIACVCAVTFRSMLDAGLQSVCCGGVDRASLASSSSSDTAKTIERFHDLWESIDDTEDGTRTRSALQLAMLHESWWSDPQKSVERKDSKGVPSMEIPVALKV